MYLLQSVHSVKLKVVAVAVKLYLFTMQLQNLLSVNENLQSSSFQSRTMTLTSLQEEYNQMKNLYQ